MRSPAPLRAVLIVGPTGVGKTPLGEALDRNGLLGSRCCHFDFGQALRDAAEGGGVLDPAENVFVRRLLEEGALLEDDRFPLALKLLRAFIADREMKPADILVLNGIPRHSGQARDISPVADVRVVIALRASPETVAERIRRDTGGDRRGREDDSPADIARKLKIFADRTAPLLDHYRRAGVELRTIDVGIETTAEEVVRMIETRAGDNKDDDQG
ncbi:MAG: hypothetical protein FJ224_02810 [Lentisphaerae bacterium]|nr:hypothetical protein [Lentisphaerota bacterium]